MLKIGWELLQMQLLNDRLIVEKSSIYAVFLGVGGRKMQIVLISEVQFSIKYRYQNIESMPLGVYFHSNIELKV